MYELLWCYYNVAVAVLSFDCCYCCYCCYCYLSPCTNSLSSFLALFSLQFLIHWHGLKRTNLEASSITKLHNSTLLSWSQHLKCYNHVIAGCSLLQLSWKLIFSGHLGLVVIASDSEAFDQYFKCSQVYCKTNQVCQPKVMPHHIDLCAVPGDSLPTDLPATVEPHPAAVGSPSNSLSTASAAVSAKRGSTTSNAKTTVSQSFSSISRLNQLLQKIWSGGLQQWMGSASRN